MLDIEVQRCSKCEKTKGFGEYYRHPGSFNGYMAKCKDCHKEAVALRRRTNPAVQEYDRKRGNRQHAGYTKEWREKHPEAYRAHYAVTNAVRDGRMKKHPCLFCSSEENVHGHHRDYQKPLDVVWLCSQCHRRLHATFPETSAHEPKP